MRCPTLLILVCSLAPVLAQADPYLVADEIRTIPELVKHTDSFAEVRVKSSSSVGCPNSGGQAAAYYTAVVIAASSKLPSTLRFCSYGTLNLFSTYIVSIVNSPKNSWPVVPLDGIFVERLPDQFFRLVSFESHVVTVGGRTLLVEGSEEKDMASILGTWRLPR